MKKSRSIALKICAAYLLFAGVWIFASDRFLALVVIAPKLAFITLLLVGVAGIMVTLWWKQQRASYLAHYLQNELQRQALEERFESVSRHANDIIILFDGEGAIVDANDSALRTYGYNHAQIRTLNIRDLRAPGQNQSGFNWKELAEGEGIIFEALHQRRDQSTFPVEISANIVTIEGKRFYQAILRDISERKQSEKQILRLANIYATLSEANEAIMRINNQRDLFQEICRIAVEHGKFKAAFLSLIDKNTGKAPPLTSQGLPLEELASLPADMWSPSPQEESPTGLILRTRTSYICNEIEKASPATPWLRAIRKLGIAAAGIFPLTKGGRIIGTFSLFSEVVGDFSKEQIDLLEKLTTNLSYALDNFERESQRERTERELMLAAKVFESSGEAIMITDAQRNIILVNRAFTHITGYRSEEVLGKNPRLLSSGRQGRDFYQNLWATLDQTGHWQGELWNRRKNGEVFPEWVAISAVSSPHRKVTHYIAIFSDISERKAAARRIQFLSQHDALTHLPNRLLMRDRLSQALRRARKDDTKVAILLIDIDRFKNINDSLGHFTGDLLLQAVARRLEERLPGDMTIARTGGDEFVVIPPPLKESEEAAHVAQQVQRYACGTYNISGHNLVVTASIGIALFPEDGEDETALLKNADAAMYHAKKAGRDNYQFYADDMNARAFEALSMENSLRRSIDRKELLLHYQPKISLKTGCITGAEALIRWQHPDMGLILPGRFIPIAEERGVIAPIGEFILQEACQQSLLWQKKGLPPIVVAVNISPLQLHQQELPETIENILYETGLDPAWLALEFTESSIMENAERTIKVVRRLKGMGLQLSIDDFGTGYSSLSYLKRFPIDELKIDQSFIRDIAESADDKAITVAIINLARSLGLKVVAEGVESKQQVEFLKHWQCDEVQGYYFRHPLPAQEFEALLSKNRGKIIDPTRYTESEGQKEAGR